MRSFSPERRDLLKSACTMAGAAAVASVAGSLPAFAASQAKGVPEVGDVFVFLDGPNKDKVVMVADIAVDAPPVMVQAKDPKGAVREGDNATALLYRVAPDKVPDDLKSENAEGVLAFSAVCTHLGCMLSNWDAPTKAFMCPCHDAMFDPLQDGKNTGGATSRSLPHFPVKSDSGTIAVTNVPSDYVGVKRTT